MVLHSSHLDRQTCTSAKVPCMNLNVYSLNLFRGIKQFLKSDRDLSLRNNMHLFNYRVVQSTSLNLIQKIERLNYYTKLIVEPHKEIELPSSDESSSRFKNDLIYLVSNVSIYAFRQERQTIAEVQTSSLAQTLIGINKLERHDDKRMPARSEEEKTTFNNTLEV